MEMKETKATIECVRGRSMGCADSPEEHASFLSRLLFLWLTRPIFHGSRNPITEDDVYPIRPQWRSEYLMQRWAEEWKRSLEYFGKRKVAKKASKDVPKKKSEESDLPSIVYTLLRMFRPKIIAVTGMRVLADFALFANPVMLKLLIDFVSDEQSPIGYGVAIAIGLFALSEARSLCFHHVYNVMALTSIQVQSVLCNAVYGKALRMSAAARNKKTVGAVVNLMAIDIEKICQVIPTTQNYWSCPLQLTIAMCLLWWTIGASAIAGISIMLLIVPLNYFASVRIKNWQIQQMKAKDERTKICNEVLNGIKLIKMYAWEEAFEVKINALREQEVRFLRRIGLLDLIVNAGNAAAPFVVAVASFSLFVLSDESHVLTPQIAFVCLTIFNQIRTPMRVIASLINMTVQAIVSNKRLKEFMTADERVRIFYDKPSVNNAIQMREATWRWKAGQKDLSNLTFNARIGSLTAIVGAVGAGKSSLLSAIIGEMDLQEGSVALDGRIAYVPQQAWLISGTVRENVLFGKDYEEQLYSQVVTACELLTDFSILPYGDATPVGENGVSLSGGQKARISIARALYQECDIYLLDDPLSAVDAHVGAAIYQQVLGKEGLLSNRTRLLVTHGLQYTKQAENILVLREGLIIQHGSFDELEQVPGVFRELLLDKDEKKPSTTTNSSSDDNSEGDDEKEEVKFNREGSMMSGKDKRNKQAKHLSMPDTNLETVNVGKVKLEVWGSLIRAATLRYCIPFIFFYVAHFAFQIARNRWLSNWSDASSKSVVNDYGIGNRIGVYTAIGMFELTAICGALYFLVLACQQASLNLHGPMLRAILRAPMHFFDTTPIGRILNRLTRELDVIDVMIPLNLRQFVNSILQVVAIIVVISYSTPLFVTVIVPLATLYFFLLKLFIPTARQLRRLESTARSHILAIFAESIHGVTDIRAYDKIDSFCASFAAHVDKFVKTRYMLFAVTRWLAIYLELFGNFVILFAALFAVIAARYHVTSPGLIGLSVSYALSITEMMNIAVRMLSEMETNAVSVERVQEYKNAVAEAPWQSDCPPADDWPLHPSIDCSDLSLRYRAGLPLVLRGVNAQLRAGEKVAVVGRTGSGKSSLTLALFRMVEPAEGSITLDGINTANVGLHELRRKLAIIPQEPVLFSGSLRFNLDPFFHFSDEQLWKTLELCQLKGFAASSPGQLDYAIAEGGKNISVGQKQLMCLARALLRRAKVLVLDEATASVDVQTDALVQSVVREQFREATVIAIAHRLNTVAGYDKIMVLEQGKIVEFDTPARLLSDRNSRYTRMLEKSNKEGIPTK